MYDIKKIAKVSRPSLNNIYPRKRLFKLLDQGRENPVVWMQAPPGSGKTTVVNSYIDELNLPCIWYQVDEGDKDIASFFYFLKLAACDFTSSSCENLPTMSAQEIPSIANFSRNFFRALFNEFSEPGVIVIDDFHEAPVDCTLLSVLQAAVQEIPKHLQIIFISRVAPPSVFAKLRMNNTLSMLDWSELQLTSEECKGISDIYGNKNISKSQVTDLLEQTQGWAAGLVLLLQSKDSSQKFVVGESDKMVVFDYFAGEIFEKEDPKIQVLLLKTSILGQFTLKMVDSLCGYSGASEAIESFCARNYFVTQRGEGENKTYAFHPMFKEFLLSRLKNSIEISELIETKRIASKILNDAGDLNAAAMQLVEIADWAALKDHILTHLDRLFDQGRYWTAQSWLNFLPDSMIEDDPWLMYWVGVSNQPLNSKDCPEIFKKSYKTFVALEQYDGAYLSWAMAVESIIFGGTDLTLIDYWIDQLNKMIKVAPEFPTQELEARVTCCVFSANLWRNFDDADQVSYWSNRAEKMLDAPIKANYRVALGTALVTYYGRWVGNLNKCCAISERTAKIARWAEIAPLTRMMWCVVESMSLWMTGCADQAIEISEEGMKILEKSGITLLSSRLKMQIVYASLAKGDFKKCTQILIEVSGQQGQWSDNNISLYHFLTACLALEEGRPNLGKEHTALGMNLADPRDAPMRLGFINLVRAQCLFESNEIDKAYESIQLSEEWAQQVNNEHIKFQCQLSRAQWLIDQGDIQTGLEALKKSMLYGRSKNFLTHPWWGWRRLAVVRIYNLALENDIETEYVKKLIAKNKIVPADPDLVGESWPWLLKITTLGSFSILLNNEPIDTSRSSKLQGKSQGKLQGKSLELLKYIVIYGGKNVSIETLIDAVWPDAEGDAGHHAFETTLYRLRKILGNNKALLLQDARVSLNSCYVWVDIISVKRILKTLEKAVENSSSDEINAMSQEIFNLYAGDFLIHAEKTPGVGNFRDKLRQNVLRALALVGEFFETKEDWLRASDIYQNSILISPVTEKFYTRLMACQHQMGKSSDMILSYQRCRDALFAELGTVPSKETEVLHIKAKS